MQTDMLSDSYCLLRLICLLAAVTGHDSAGLAGPWFRPVACSWMRHRRQFPFRVQGVGLPRMQPQGGGVPPERSLPTIWIFWCSVAEEHHLRAGFLALATAWLLGGVVRPSQSGTRE